MKPVLPLLLLTLFAIARPAAAQDYSGNLLPGGTVNLTTNLGSTTSIPLGGSLDAVLTVNPATPSASFDSLTANDLQLPDLVNTQYVTTGFTSTDEITTDIHFNPINFSVPAASPTPVTLTPGTGSVTPYYNFSTYGEIYNYYSTSLALSGTYSVTGTSGIATGTFSVSVPVYEAYAYIEEGSELQTGGYPSSLVLSGYGSIEGGVDPTAPTVLFSQAIDGSTVSPTFSGISFNSGQSVALTVAPEPSVSGYLLAMVGGFVLWRGLRVVRQPAISRS